jgi:hypothetical protein
MIVAEIADVDFKKCPNRHSATYEEIGKLFTEYDWKRDIFDMVMKAVIADDVNDATYKLNNVLKSVLDNKFKHDKVTDFNYSDFTFRIRYRNVDNENTFFKLKPYTEPLETVFILSDSSCGKVATDYKLSTGKLSKVIKYMLNCISV